jgi:hypothetical protein
MAKANSTNTTIPADSWRDHQLRRRAKGAGKFPMKHGRYSGTRKTLHNGVVARPPLTLSPAQIAALEEFCTLTHYGDGFTVTPAMQRVCKAISDRATPAAQHAILAHAHARELAYITR